ncbi:MAG: hypothetical protein AAF733_12205, partial [Verrucomicrobiota bacterium]
MRLLARQLRPRRNLRPASQPILCAALAAAIVFGSGSSAEAKDWKVYKLGGRDYVTDENVAKFYGFQGFKREGSDRIFKHASLIMSWKIGSQSIYVNNIKFNLSFPVVESSGRAMISTVDLAKLVDPVVRP